jgi:hypothetical protein
MYCNKEALAEILLDQPIENYGIIGNMRTVALEEVSNPLPTNSFNGPLQFHAYVARPGPRLPLVRAFGTHVTCFSAAAM